MRGEISPGAAKPGSTCGALGEWMRRCGLSKEGSPRGDTTGALPSRLGSRSSSRRGAASAARFSAWLARARRKAVRSE
ncbi:hypothetical protein N8D56_02960 [Devosia sp. A8/3-2]|nr:hypothetical protein N8D56_02960 [Devosia sp. A8/3-2]